MLQIIVIVIIMRRSSMIIISSIMIMNEKEIVSRKKTHLFRNHPVLLSSYPLGNGWMGSDDLRGWGFML